MPPKHPPPDIYGNFIPFIQGPPPPQALRRYHPPRPSPPPLGPLPTLGRLICHWCGRWDGEEAQEGGDFWEWPEGVWGDWGSGGRGGWWYAPGTLGMGHETPSSGVEGPQGPPRFRWDN